MKNKVNKNQGVKISNARVWVGWDKGIYLKKIIGSPAKRAWRAGKKEEGLGEGIFVRPLPLGGGWASPKATHGSEFSVRILFKKSSDFVQKVPPIFNFSVFEGCCLALAPLGLGKSNDFIRIFEIQKQFLPEQTEVPRAMHKQNEVLQTNLFSFAEGERQSDNFKYFDCPIII